VPADIAAICGSDYAVDKNYDGYKGIYDRGHLAPAGNFKSTQKRTDLTFSFANAAPQNSNFNQTGWRILEEKTERGNAKKYNGITVITGVIQSKDKYIKNNIGVPDYYYKIILWLDNSGQINKEVYLAQNIKGAVPKPFDIKYLENLSGMDFGF
jgi:endonuclease G, mitochondrial